MADRARWASRTIFIFAAIGSAVGLGNVWRFPYLTHKFGGGAFLIPYILALFIIGIPLLILEFAIGQKMQKGAVESFRAINKKLSGVGIAAIFASFIVVIYYAVVLAWSLLFFLKSFNPRLPWAGNSKSYFFTDVLGLTESVNILGGIQWPVLTALLAVWIAIYFIVWKGVKSVGKVVVITMPLPVILLFILLIRGITLPGSLEGIIAYLNPDFSALLSLELWMAATSQIFFSLSVGFGVMIAYASYNKKKDRAVGNAYITSISDAAIGLLAGFVVFSIIGYMAFANNVPIEDAITSGPGLAFVVFPEALSLMPFAWFFAALFFLMLLTLGIDSAFSLIEGVNAVIADRQKNPNSKKIALLTCSTAFVLGIIFTTGAGLYILDIVDHFVTNYVIILVGLFTSIAVGWVYGAEKMRLFLNSSGGAKVGKWWNVSIKYIIPLALIILLINQLITDIANPYEGYPAWALSIGWAVVIIPILASLAVSFRKK